jgi:hypothetical protein
VKLIKTLTWSAAFAAGVFLGSASQHTTAHASPVVSSSQQDPVPDPNVTDRQDRDRGGEKAEPASITGELSHVDTQSRTFSVKSAAGAEMLFRYDDRTIITGAEKNVAGLATSSGAEVTVTYRNDTAGNIAAKIEVHAKR